MAKKKPPVKKSQPSYDANQIILGVMIGAVASFGICGGIYLLTQSGGSSSPQTVASNSEPASDSNVAMASTAGGNIATSNAAGASAGSSAPDMSAEMAAAMQGSGSGGSSIPGAAGAPAGSGSLDMSSEMAAAMQGSGSGGSSIPGAAGAPAGSGSLDMSSEMAAAMQGSGSGGASIPGTPGSVEMSLNGEGTSSGGTETKRATVQADAAFLDELSNIEVAAEELSLPDLIDKVEPSVVRINTRSKDGYSVGSGYVVSSSGLVVTNYHVIEGIKEATVEFSDGTKGEVTGYRYFDPKYDIAVIQIEVKDRVLVPLPLAEELPRKGASVVAFGAPHGLSFTTTEGIISAIRTQKEMQTQMGLPLNGTWLQTSTPISPGNSGGPLVNMHGQVVAMNTMQMTVGQDLNFAVSSIDVLDLAKQASGSKVEKLDPAKLTPINRSLKRRLAPNIAGTERGNELLAGIDEMWLLLAYQNSSIDSSGQLKRTIYTHAQSAIEKIGIKLSFGEPSGDAALMIVTLKTNLLRKAAPGTQMVTLDAFLVGIDPEVKSSNKMVKLWSIDDVDIGTVALQAISQGFIPRSFPPKFTSFFNKFRTAQSRAKRAVKTKEG